MAIAIRGTTPLVVASTANPISGTLTGTRQPQAGDVLLIIHGNDYYTLADMPTPTVGGSTSGVNAVSNGSADGGSFFAHAKSYTYAVGSTGDLTVSVTETGVGDEEKVLVVYVLSGADTSTPVDVAAGGFDSTGSTSKVSPSVSPTSSDAYLVCHTNDGNGSNSGSYTPPSGMTEQYDGSLAGSMGYSGATLQLGASGATGTKTFAGSGSSSYGTLSIAVRTAAGGSPALDPGVPNWSGPAPGLFTGPNSFASPWSGTGVDATTGATVTPSTVAATAAIDLPTTATGSTVSPTTVAGTATVGTATISTGSTVSATTVAGSTTIPAPTVRTGSTATPAVVAGTATVGTTTVRTGSTVTAATVAAAATVPTPTVSTGSRVTASAVSGSATIPTPAVSAGGNATVSPAVVSAAATVPAPTVRTGVTITLTTVAGVAAIASPTIRAGAGVTPATVAAAVSIPTPSVSTGAVVPGTLHASTSGPVLTPHPGESTLTARQGGPNLTAS